MRSYANFVAQALAYLALGLLLWLVSSSLTFLFLSGHLGDPRILTWQRPIAWLLYARLFGRDWMEELYLVVSALPAPAMLLGWFLHLHRRNRVPLRRPFFFGRNAPSR